MPSHDYIHLSPFVVQVIWIHIPYVYVSPGVLVSQVLMLRALKRCLQLISCRGALYRCRFNGVYDIDSQVPQLWDIDSCQKLQPAHVGQKIKANLRGEQLFVHLFRQSNTLIILTTVQ